MSICPCRLLSILPLPLQRLFGNTAYNQVELNRTTKKVNALDISIHDPAEATNKMDRNFKLINQKSSFFESIKSCFKAPPEFICKPLPEEIALENIPLFVDQNRVSIASTQGRRVAMEDHYLVEEIRSQEDGVYAQVYAVFDGHAGDGAALFLKGNFTKHFMDCYRRFAAAVELMASGIEKQNFILENSIRIAFVDLQKKWLDDSIKDNSGSTAIVAIIINNTLYVGNLGDSRAVLFDGREIVHLSKDQKPDYPRQEKRIIKLGGSVMCKDNDIPRINGLLGVGGAFGDQSLNGVVPIKADVVSYDLRQIDKDKNFLILGCDGLWDVVTSNEAVQFGRMEADVDAFAEHLVCHAYHKKSTDNITVMTLRLRT